MRVHLSECVSVCQLCLIFAHGCWIFARTWVNDDVPLRVWAFNRHLWHTLQSHGLNMTYSSPNAIVFEHMVYPMPYLLQTNGCCACHPNDASYLRTFWGMLEGCCSGRRLTKTSDSVQRDNGNGILTLRMVGGCAAAMVNSDCVLAGFC